MTFGAGVRIRANQGRWKYGIHRSYWNNAIWDPNVKWASKTAGGILQWYTWSYCDKRK